MKNKVLIAAVIILLGIGVNACRTENNTPDDSKPVNISTPTPKPGEDVREDDNTKDDVNGKADNNKGETEADNVTSTPVPTEIPADLISTPTPVPEPEYEDASDALYSMSIAECEKVLSKITGTGYSFKVTEKEADIDGTVYCVFEVSDLNGAITPYMAVDREDGAVAYYSDGKLYDFTAFPPDNAEVPDSDTETKDEASDYLSGFSKEQLGLPKELDEYALSQDEWTSVIDGNECYCINVFEKSGANGILTAVYYVSVDMTEVYRLDEDGNFAEVK